MCVCVGGGGGVLDLTQSPVHLQGRWGRVCVCVWRGGGGGDLTRPPFIFRVGGDGGGDSGSHQVLRSSSR